MARSPAGWWWWSTHAGVIEDALEKTILLPSRDFERTPESRQYNVVYLSKEKIFYVQVKINVHCKVYREKHVKGFSFIKLKPRDLFRFFEAIRCYIQYAFFILRLVLKWTFKNMTSKKKQWQLNQSCCLRYTCFFCDAELALVFFLTDDYNEQLKPVLAEHWKTWTTAFKVSYQTHLYCFWCCCLFFVFLNLNRNKENSIIKKPDLRFDEIWKTILKIVFPTRYLAQGWFRFFLALLKPHNPENLSAAVVHFLESICKHKFILKKKWLFAPWIFFSSDLM